MASQSRPGCWTCKRYDRKLVWPNQPDGRRKTPNLPTHTAPELDHSSGFYYGQQFLNISFDDFEQGRRGLGPLSLLSKTNTRPQQSLNLVPELQGHDADLLLYYREKIAGLISTVDANNGFRQELLPMAMASDDFAAQALRSAMIALSAFHLHGTGAALPYKTKAITYLNRALQPESIVDGQLEPQIAASMMLCVYNVFDESEGDWHIYLDGSRKMLQIYADKKGGALGYDFLNTWFLYHEILGAFSQPHKHRYEGAASLELIRGSELDKSVIIGSLGCSIEIMEIIHNINQLRYIATRKSSEEDMQPDYPPVMWTYKGLHDRLSRHKQQLPPDYQQRPVREQTKVQLTAELYRIAALLYLRAICPSTNTVSRGPDWIDSAFEVLGGLEICTSPWPLFVVACESQTDQQRITILRTLDRMDEDRKIGNVHVLRSLIENFWKQQDLQADEDRVEPLRWWELRNSNSPAPWFI
ncbi:hypothetical protein M406DRAFT_352432 [Cryphonectria parasitica EP155]|uniref:Uncharacterized protein n=1 Tax=Cryphonectria parasitica (strain ATCC 38755 / EP155) TaxID=660469 RepID=A0A9P5CM25_CRYP1|nr:uncharacterized protein M406DRAFT_352432 [Cryphonectria parasitica EP155]KAF3763683.1 hypothetical protein M406DRAFT_352432 [Cryphonectria parasitica EP155]